MSKPWHEVEPNVTSELRVELGKKYPDLRLTIDGEIGHLVGSFPIVHEGVELDRFEIKVRVPAEFPRELPTVYEVGGRIPHDVDWHTFKAGNLCVIVPEEWFLNQNYRSLIAYLEGPLRNYFVNHALAEAGHVRPMGERRHGSRGLYDAYGDMVGTTDTLAIIRYLRFCASPKIKAHWKCPCGSGKRVEICHLAHVLSLRKQIPQWVASKAFNRLKDVVESEWKAKEDAENAKADACRARPSGVQNVSSAPIVAASKAKLPTCSLVPLEAESPS